MLRTINEKQIEEMMNDIGPTKTINHSGKEQQVIFYSKESLAKILIARGWTKMNLEQNDDYYIDKDCK